MQVLARSSSSQAVLRRFSLRRCGRRPLHSVRARRSRRLPIAILFLKIRFSWPEFFFGAAGPFEPEKPFGSEPLFGSKEARSGQTLGGHGCDFWEAEWRWVTLSSRSAPPSAPPSRFELSWRQLLVGSITQPVGGQNALIGIISPTCPSQIGVSASRASVGFTFVQFQCALSAMRRICSNVRVSGCGSWWSALLRAQSRHGRFEREQKTRVDPRPTLLVSLGSHFLSAPSLQWWL